MSTDYIDVESMINGVAAKVTEKLAREKKIKAEPMEDAMDSKLTGKAIKIEQNDDNDFRRPGSGGSRGRMGPPRSSSDRYINEREENDERRARRSKELGDEDLNAAHGGSDKDSANGSIRSKARSRSPHRDYRRNDRSRERLPRDSYHSSGRRGDDSYRPGDRGYDRGSRGPERSRYDDDYRGGGGYGRRGGRESRDSRDDHREGGRSGGRDRRGTPPPQPTEDERDKRTVFVQQLAARLRTKQLKEFFEQAGPVADAQIVKDRVSQRSKGVGYVEFRDEESVQKAIQMTGQKLCGIPIIAQLTEAEKNRQAKNTEGVPTQSNGIPFHRLYVGNIHFSITEEDLRSVFAPFGELEFVQLQKEEAGRSKGYGFVQFINPTEAKDALDKMNGFELAGRPIRVGLGNDKFTPESTTALLQRFGNQAHNSQNPQGSSFSGMGGRGAHAGGASSFDRPAAARDADKTGGASALDDTDVGGVNFSNYSRESLMRKLARTDEPEQKIAPKTHQKQAAVVQPTASRCVLIKNVYDQATETEVGWQKELEAEMREECDDKYGKVIHLGLALDNNDGEVYVKFDRVQGGENAVKGLNGRWFGGRQLTASYVVDAVYNMIFPKAPN